MPPAAPTRPVSPTSTREPAAGRSVPYGIMLGEIADTKRRIAQADQAGLQLARADLALIASDAAGLAQQMTNPARRAIPGPPCNLPHLFWELASAYEALDAAIARLGRPVDVFEPRRR